MDDFANLRLFLDVADTRSFSRAAERHGVSQPAASQRVAQLEAKLGAKLLDRGVRPPALTEAGRRYAEGCRSLLAAHERLVKDVAASLESESGPVVVRVAAIYSAGIAWLDEAADRHVEAVKTATVRGDAARAVRVRVEYTSPAGVEAAVRGGDADFGVVSFAESFAGLRSRPLREEEMAVVCPPGHPLAREASVAAKHLGKHAPLRFDAKLPVGRATDAYFAASGITFGEGHRFDNLDTLKAAVAETGRFAVLPLRPCTAELDAGNLVSVALRPPLVRPIGLLFPRGKGGSPEAEAFAEVLLAEAAADAPLAADRDRKPARRPTVRGGGTVPRRRAVTTPA